MSRSKPVTHFSSFYVHYTPPGTPDDGSRITLQLVEEDVGGPEDFCNIQLDLIVKRQTPEETIVLPIDHLLTVFQFSEPPLVSVYLHKQGALPFGTLSFSNGRDACEEFLSSLRDHALLQSLDNPYSSGVLYAVDAKPRMRRAAPTLTSLYYPQPGEPQTRDVTTTGIRYYGDNTSNENADNDGEFAALLSELRISHPTQRTFKPDRSADGAPPIHEFAMSLLSQFARVTQAARDTATHVAELFEERQNQTVSTREDADRRARSTALDIHAEIVASTTVEDELPPRLELDHKRGLPINRVAWLANIDDQEKVTYPSVVAHAVVAGGVDPPLRPSLWPFILGVYPWDSTKKERLTILENLRKEYAELKQRSLSSLAEAEAAHAASPGENAGGNNFEDNRENISKPHLQRLLVDSQIQKDVVRTDRKIDMFLEDDAPGIQLMATLLNVYAEYNSTILYCQGMSDFLAPIVHVLGLKDETLLFWCFEKLMSKMEINFRIDQSGMHAQLGKLKAVVRAADAELAAYFEETDPQYYSCFRWVVVRFKRELPFEDVIKLWEVLWSQPPGCEDLHIFIAAGLLMAHRKRLLALERGAFDRLLRYVNDMSMRIDVDFAIQEGEWCFRKWSQVLSSR